ncbi:hypothetical protein Ahy_B09g096834 isoform D [Arachis hypogaea]
MRIHI